ncbi:MAG: sulfurtransferase [Fibrobacter sp.]|nr:sulfurtransferase [Fibrobacter sp.]
MMNLPNVEWINPKWLNENLHNPDLSIIDCQPDVHDYIKAHIEGAVYFNENHLRAFSGNLPTHYSPPECIANLFSLAGLKSDKSIAVYGGNGVFSKTGDGLEQSMIAYSLARFGSSHILILDGGLEKWTQEGFNTSKEFPGTSPSDFKLSIQNDLFLTYKQFCEIRNNKNTTVVDVRPRVIYEGRAMWSKPGHIPGAVNLPWRVLMNHDNPRLLRPRPQIEELLQTRKVFPDKSVILYCGTGREATSAFLVLKYLLNYPDVKIFEGSFTEWCTHPENPTTTGPGPVDKI